MAEANTTFPKFHNEAGLASISIGAHEFECVGALPPHDHPHIYLDMGEKSEITCPYCSTLFRFDAGLGVMDSIPPGLLYGDGKVSER